SLPELFHKAFEPSPIPLIPLFGSLRRAPPDGIYICLLCPAECWLEGFPPCDSFVHAVVRMCPAQRGVRKCPLTGIETVTLVNERCAISAASGHLTREDGLPPIGIARPLVQHQHAGKVCQIRNSGQQFAR